MLLATRCNSLVDTYQQAALGNGTRSVAYIQRGRGPTTLPLAHTSVNLVQPHI